MDAQLMSNLIVGFVDFRGGALFHEIVSEVGSPAFGEATLCWPNPNVVLWTNVSEMFIEAMNLAWPRLDHLRANPVAYAFFSEELGYPGLQIVTAEEWAGKKLDFDKPRWLPLVFFVQKSGNARDNMRGSAPWLDVPTDASQNAPQSQLDAPRTTQTASDEVTVVHDSDKLDVTVL